MSCVRFNPTLGSVLAVAAMMGMIAEALGQGQGDPCWEVPCVEWNCRYWQNGQGQDVCFVATQDSCLKNIFASWSNAGSVCKEKIPFVTMQVYTCTDCSDYCPSHTGQACVCGHSPNNITNCHTPISANQKLCSPLKADPVDPGGL